MASVHTRTLDGVERLTFAINCFEKQASNDLNKVIEQERWYLIAPALTFIQVTMTVWCLAAKVLLQVERWIDHSLLWMRLSVGLTLCAHSVQLPS